MVAKYVPDRGDVIYLEFSPQRGGEQSGRRPALVLSPKAYNEKVGLLIACPITSQIKGYPFEVILPELCQTVGVVLSDHVRSLDWRSRKGAFCEKVPHEVTERVLKKLQVLVEG